MNVLILEDDPFIARAVVAALTAEGFTITHETDGIAGIGALEGSENGYFDVLLLDLGLPGTDGMAVLERLRASEREYLKKLPVLILTARDALDSRLKGLNSGADDYILKPFHMSELLARMRAVLRRRTDADRSTLRVPGLTLNIRQGTCEVNGVLVQLTRRETDLLRALMVRPGAILSRSALETKLYGESDIPEGKAVEFLIHGVRKKIGSEMIENLRGLGWRIRNTSPAAK